MCISKARAIPVEALAKLFNSGSARYSVTLIDPKDFKFSCNRLSVRCWTSGWWSCCKLASKVVCSALLGNWPVNPNTIWNVLGLTKAKKFSGFKFPCPICDLRTSIREAILAVSWGGSSVNPGGKSLSVRAACWAGEADLAASWKKVVAIPDWEIRSDCDIGAGGTAARAGIPLTMTPSNRDKLKEIFFAMVVKSAFRGLAYLLIVLLSFWKWLG